MAKPQNVDVSKVSGAIVQVWNAIAYDLDEAAATCGERVTNTAAVEACIDADRLVTFARDAAAEAEVQRAIAAVGYPAVLRKLAREIKLV